VHRPDSSVGITLLVELKMVGLVMLPPGFSVGCVMVNGRSGEVDLRILSSRNVVSQGVSRAQEKSK